MDISIYSTIREIDSTQWEQYVSKRFFLSYNYLQTLEVACPQLEYRYVVCTEDDEFLALCYFQIIPFYGRNLEQYVPRSPLFQQLFNLTLGRIRTNLLVLGNVIFTCENGFLITEKGKGREEDVLNNSINSVLGSFKTRPLGTMISENIQQVSSKLFCPKKFHEFRVEDRMELNLDGLKTFDEYLNKLQSKYRVRLNKVLSLNKKTETFELTQSNFSQYRAALDSLFTNVLDNSKFKLTTLSIDYFYAFLQHVPRFKMLGYVVEGKLVAFVSYFQLDTINEIHYIGLDYQYNKSHKIYNFILIDMIQKAFETHSPRVCFGRTAQELKSTLGAKPYSTLSSLKINQPILNMITPIFLNRMTPEIWVPRQPFKND